MFLPSLPDRNQRNIVTLAHQLHFKIVWVFQNSFHLENKAVVAMDLNDDRFSTTITSFFRFPSLSYKWDIYTLSLPLNIQSFTTPAVFSSFLCVYTSYFFFSLPCISFAKKHLDTSIWYPGSWNNTSIAVLFLHCKNQTVPFSIVLLTLCWCIFCSRNPL